MRFWDNIKNYFYQRSLNEKLSAVKTEHSLISMEAANSIGIAFDSSDPANDTVILSFAERLRSEGKEVDILGLVKDKKTESKDGMAVLNPKSLNWAGVPQGETVEKFSGKKFDLLLACFTGENLPLEYIAGTSQARWRVGVYAETKTGLYDMMVNVGERKDLPYLLEQMVYFLNYIKAA